MTSNQETLTPGNIDGIPVRNIWLLFLYASQLYRELPTSRRVELEDAPDDIPYLVAEILTRAVERRLRRNLSHGYRRLWADLSRVRGRIDHFRTERRQLLQRGRVACVFDELTVDTPRNRYVKTALMHIAGLINKFGKHSNLERRSLDLAVRLEKAGVVGGFDSRYGGSAAELDNVGWVDTHERRMLAAAKLALNLSIPTEGSGLSLLPVASRSDPKGWKLYENAVAGFYDVALSPMGWQVTHGGHIEWPVSDPTPGLRDILPDMVTDIVLERRDRSVPDSSYRIVIDTKFTSIVQRSQYGQQRLKSGNMYQLYTYLLSQERPEDPLSQHSTGVLLYPSLGQNYDESATIQGHRVRFATVDLAADSQEIRRDLMRIVDR